MHPNMPDHPHKELKTYHAELTLHIESARTVCFCTESPGTFSTERTYKTVKACEIDELSHVSESARYRNKLYERTRYEE